MEFNDVLSLRQSTRKYKSDQITKAELDALLKAANTAAVSEDEGQ